jgi:hypothetical protein
MWGLTFLYRTLAQVKADEQTNVVSIVYNPDDPFTAAEQACIKDLLDPKV